jgi:hypothetical protein
VTNEQGEICGLGPWTSGPAPAARGLPIENHAFAGSLSPNLWIGGSFTAPGVASGSFDLSPLPPRRFGGGGLPSHCPSEPVSWSAVGDPIAPALLMNSDATQPRGHKTVKVRFSCPGEPCTALARGVVSVRAPGVERRFGLLSGPSSASCLGLRDTAVCLAQVTTASGAGCCVFYELGLARKASRRVTIRRAWEPWCSEPRPAASAAGVRIGRAATLVRWSAGAPRPQRLSRSD